jgi:large subunit ribosomal protein L21
MEFDMYAVIKTGGKQYRVVAGEKIRVEQILAEIGSEIEIDQVLMVSDGDKTSMGRPLVDGATVKATVLGQGRHDKVRIFKMRRRKHYQKHQGHRQNYTEIQITDISAYREHRRWPIKKQAEVLGMAATRIQSDLELKDLVEN